jgi:hypothetical protein
MEHVASIFMADEKAYLLHACTVNNQKGRELFGDPRGDRRRY